MQTPLPQPGELPEPRPQPTIARPVLSGASTSTTNAWLYVLALVLVLGCRRRRATCAAPAPGASISATRDNERAADGRGHHRRRARSSRPSCLSGMLAGLAGGHPRRRRSRGLGVNTLPGGRQPAAVLDGRHRRPRLDRRHDRAASLLIHVARLRVPDDAQLLLTGVGPARHPLRRCPAGWARRSSGARPVRSRWVADAASGSCRARHRQA